ncbi:MAG: tetratricopeptide repeat protein, partial [Candidatus Omnitrophota bacterium]
LSLLTKESGIVAVGLIFSYEIIYGFSQKREGSRNPRGRGGGMLDFKAAGRYGWNIFLRLTPFFLISLFYLGLRQHLFGGIIISRGVVFTQRSLLDNIFTQAAVSFYYLYLFVFPLGLSIDHYFPVINGFSNPSGYLSLIAIVILILVCVFAKKRVPAVVRFSCLWYLISLSPKFLARLTLVCSEHHTYVAYFSLYFIAAFFLSKLARKRYLKELFIFIFGLFFLLTVVRNFHWRNEYSLWTATLKVNPRSEFAHGGLGRFFMERGLFSRAEKHLIGTIYSSNPYIRTTSLLNLATVYALDKEAHKGLDILNRYRDDILKINAAKYYKTLVFIYSRTGDNEKAVSLWQKLIEVEPNNADLKAIMGNIYLDNLSDEQTARSYFAEAVKLNPDCLLGNLGLAKIAEESNPNQAVVYYKKVIELSPEMWEAYYRLGYVYAKKLGNPLVAEDFYKRAIEFNPGFAPVYRDLAALYLSFFPAKSQQALIYLKKAESLGYNPDKQGEDRLNK